MNAKIERRSKTLPSGIIEWELYVNDVLIAHSKYEFPILDVETKLKNALGLANNRETWRIIYVPFVTITGTSESKTNHTFDTQEEAHNWIRRNPATSGLYRAERD